MRVRVAVPGAAATAAERVTFCATPGVSVSVVGCAVTPVGKPVMVTGTLAMKPFVAVALTAIGCVAPPGMRVRDVGVADREKSAMAVGLELPSQDVSMRQSRKLKHAPSFFDKASISTSGATVTGSR